MGSIRLYRTFYVVNVVASGNTTSDIYTQINPFSLSANTFLAGTLISAIESGFSITNESLGVFFADLNPFLYTVDNTYDLVWYVQYTSIAPVKKLITRFRINAINIGQSVDVEVMPNNTEIEIFQNSIEIEIFPSI
jgi:hypothetical protein